MINNGQRLVLSISGSDYLHICGGTNKVIAAHQAMLSEKKIQYVQIFPFRILERNCNKPSHLWGVNKDGKFAGVYSSEEIIVIIEKYSLEGILLSEVHVHQLMNCYLDEVSKILNMLLPIPIRLYLHDFHIVCISNNLTRNGETYCGPERPNITKCSSCSYWQVAKQKVSEYSAFLEKYESYIEFIAPSNVVKEIWCTTFPQYSNSTHVLFHQELLDYYKGNMDIIHEDTTLKVAFVGGGVAIKGWPAYVSAVNKCLDQKQNIEWLILGNADDIPKGIRCVSVSVQCDQEAMIKALRREKIHIVLLWSIWPETYSYTYYESLSANSFVITNINSGNICRQVQERGNGIVLKNEDELCDLLCNEDKLRELVNSFRKIKKYGPKVLRENNQLLEMLHTPNKECIDKHVEKKKVKKRNLRKILYRIKVELKGK